MSLGRIQTWKEWGRRNKELSSEIKFPLSIAMRCSDSNGSYMQILQKVVFWFDILRLKMTEMKIYLNVFEKINEKE